MLQLLSDHCQNDPKHKLKLKLLNTVNCIHNKNKIPIPYNRPHPLVACATDGAYCLPVRVHLHLPPYKQKHMEYVRYHGEH